MSPGRSARSRQALVLAAGNGDRFHSTGTSKLLQPVLGEPLIVRTLRTASAAGITSFEIVVGYQAAAVERVVRQHAPPGVSVHFTRNADWHLENGLSALTAKDRLASDRFALLMGDHLFDPDALARAMALPIGPGESLLAVDSRAVAREIADEATKVRLDGPFVCAIGKDIEPYDAIDTGVFVCTPAVFAALEQSTATGDTTLSAGIRLLAADRRIRALDIGEAPWYDIDTPADLQAAEALLARQPTRT